MFPLHDYENGDNVLACFYTNLKMDINFKILQSKYFNDLLFFFVIKIFVLKNFKINIHQNVSRSFNILHYTNLKSNFDNASHYAEFVR